MPLAGRRIKMRVQVVYAVEPPQPCSFVFHYVKEINGEAIHNQCSANAGPEWNLNFIEKSNAHSARPFRGGNSRNRYNSRQSRAYHAKTEVRRPTIASVWSLSKSWDQRFKAEKKRHEQPKSDDPSHISGKAKPTNVLVRPFCDHVLSIPYGRANQLLLEKHMSRKS